MRRPDGKLITIGNKYLNLGFLRAIGSEKVFNLGFKGNRPIAIQVNAIKSGRLDALLKVGLQGMISIFATRLEERGSWEIRRGWWIT